MFVKMPSYGFRYSAVTKFDRSIIRKNWKRMNEDPLRRAGNIVRVIARRMIRRRKKGGRPGPAGQPPFSRRPGKLPPFKMIFNDTIPVAGINMSHVVGMVGFRKHPKWGPPVPGIHEHGASNVMRMVPEYRKRKVRTGKRGRPREKKYYVLKKRLVTYPKRPFMLPALEKARPYMAILWHSALSKVRR